jgi:hypothetical protein
VLRPNGTLVFSCGHPCADAKYLKASYFQKHQMNITWRGFGEVQVVMPSFHRPLQEMLNAIANSGLVLRRVLEPLPTEQFRLADPEGYQELMEAPGSIVFRASKPS